MNKFKKNCILCGEIDFHCLLCEETFNSEANLERHIRWENHRKNLKNNVYVPKLFRNSSIVKIGNHFYCEVCNIIFYANNQVSLHIKDHQHEKNRMKIDEDDAQKVLVKRDGGFVTITNIKISELEWNGIIDGHCVFCDSDVVDPDKHTKLREHVINLIQSKVQYLEGDHYYRMIGVNHFYCFVCKISFGITLFDDHWNSKEHTDKFQKLNNTIDNEAKSSFNAELADNVEKKFSFANVTDINHSIEIANKFDVFKKGDFDIDLINFKAVCKICRYSPSFTVEAITEHIILHKRPENASGNIRCVKTATNIDESFSSDETENLEKENCFNIIDHGLMRAQLANLGRLHYIKLGPGGSKGYCSLCDVLISAHIRNFQEHITGSRHKSRLELKYTAISSTKKKTKKTKL